MGEMTARGFVGGVLLQSDVTESRQIVIAAPKSGAIRA